MGTKMELLLDQSRWYAGWNEQALKDWARGDKCHLGDGTSEFYGPYSIDAVEIGKVVMDCPHGPPPLPIPGIYYVMGRGKKSLALADEEVGA